MRILQKRLTQKLWGMESSSLCFLEVLLMIQSLVKFENYC